MKQAGGPEKKSFKKGLEYLRTLDYIPKTHIDFFEDIAKAHHKAKDHIAKDKIYPSITKKAAQEMLSQGFPVVNFDRMRIKMRPLRAHFREICRILSKYEKKMTTSFLKSEHYRKLDPKQLIRNVLSHDANYLKSLSEKTGVEENTLKFIAIALSRPIFEVAAGEVGDKIKDDLWWKNCCPVCGSEPIMAKVQRKDGMRILGCSLCGREWRFDRIKCPFCGNDEQKTIKFFFYHEKSPHRLYVCDKCKRYIKSVDERKIAQAQKIDMTIQDMVTLYLDTLAKEKGYISPWFSDNTS